MTEKELENQYSDYNRPYNDSELRLHFAHRDFKSTLEIIHAHNFSLLKLVEATRAYLAGTGPKPKEDLCHALVPGKIGNNCATSNLEKLVEIAAEYGPGHVPRLPILLYASRSSVTLTLRLSMMFHDDSIVEAGKEINMIFEMLLAGEMYYDENDKIGYKEELMRKVESFVEYCGKYAVALTGHMRKLEGVPCKGDNPQETVLLKDVKIIKRNINHIAKEVHGTRRKTKLTQGQLLQWNAFKSFYMNPPTMCSGWKLKPLALKFFREHSGGISKFGWKSANSFYGYVNNHQAEL